MAGRCVAGAWAAGLRGASLLLFVLVAAGAQVISDGPQVVAENGGHSQDGNGDAALSPVGQAGSPDHARGLRGPRSTELKLGEAEIGDTHQGNKAILSGRIYSADWARADRLRVQLNGKRIDERQLGEDGRFSLPMRFDKDGFVTIEAIGEAGATYQAVYPGFFPYAYSNPIFVDADKDGQWTPPGL